MTEEHAPGGPAVREARTSLGDVAEDALRRWLATGRHRAGERLPPEQELCRRGWGSRAGRCARRCSGWRRAARSCAGRAAAPSAGGSTAWTLDEGLEKLVSYHELARRRGLRLELAHLEIEQRPLGAGQGRLFGLDPQTSATTITRVLVMDGAAGAHMRDVIHPDVALPAPAKLRSALERGQMVLDVLLKFGVPVAYNRSRIKARVLTSRDPIGKALAEPSR